MTVQAYPLSWPAGWKRTAPQQRRRAAFGTAKHVSFAGGGGYTQRSAATVADGIKRLQLELDRLGARSVTLSTNVETRLDGLPRSGQREPDDPGAAVYFSLDKRPIALACDKWDRTADNIIALAKHIEAMRGMDRWGVGSLSQAFAGYAALPSPEQKRPWWDVLGVPSTASRDEIEAAYRKLARQFHPDVNPDGAAAMSEINRARDEALK